MNPFSFIAAMAAIGVLQGILVVLGCLLVVLIAGNPWITIALFAAFYALVGALIEATKA